MTSEQERQLRAIATVLLDLADAPLKGYVPPPHNVPPRRDDSMLAQLIDCAENHPAFKEYSESVRITYARQLVRDLLSIMDGDPGHDVTAHVVPATKERTTALRMWSSMIQAIRRGE